MSKAYNIVITVQSDDPDQAFDQKQAIIEALIDLEQEGVLDFAFDTQVHETLPRREFSCSTY